MKSGASLLECLNLQLCFIVDLCGGLWKRCHEKIKEIRLPINSRDIILDGCCDREHQNGSHVFYVLISICKSFRSICFFCIWKPCLGGDCKTFMLMAWDWSGGAWRREWRNLCFDFVCFLEFFVLSGF